MKIGSPKKNKSKSQILKNSKIRTLIVIAVGLVVLVAFGSYVGIKAYQNKKIAEAVNLVNGLYQKNDALLAEGVTDSHIIRAGKAVDGIRDKDRQEELKFRVTAARTMWNTTAMVNNLYENNGQIALPKVPLDPNDVKKADEALEDLRTRYKKELLYSILRYRLDDAVQIDTIRAESEKLVENNEENQNVYDDLIAKLKQIKNPELQGHYFKELNEKAQPLGIVLVEALVEQTPEPTEPAPEVSPTPEVVYQPEEAVVEEPPAEEPPAPTEEQPQPPAPENDDTGTEENPSETNPEDVSGEPQPSEHTPDPNNSEPTT